MLRDMNPSQQMFPAAANLGNIMFSIWQPNNSEKF